MAPPPLLSLRDMTVTFGGGPLFDAVDLTIFAGDRACLVGRNGSGKSTLLKVAAGLIEADGGTRTVRPGSVVTYLPQDPVFTPDARVFDHVEGGLSDPDQRHRADRLIETLSLDPAARLDTLSGGEGRRADLARALASEPDLLLLDEPTNHLDLPTILWLEEALNRFPGALVMISHDRAFLTRLSRKSLWMDRGVLRVRDEGFAAYEAWTDEVERNETAELNRVTVRLKEESRWLQRGVTARRKRNMGRLRGLYALREKKARLLANRNGNVNLGVDTGEGSGKVVVEAETVDKSFGDTPIIRGFSTRIMRGDRIGVVGPNGAGKTTLLRILMGQMEPDRGSVRLGTNLTPTFFDQRRAKLNPEASLWDTLCERGGDQVMVRGRARHVVSYLRDFLFDERQARSPVKSLSGGERNRLLLAKLLAHPTNMLILDEPTNDLDMETLDLLQELLGEYEGTLMLVSHDRDFLDRLVNSVIVFEGDGKLVEHAGGYSDYIERTGRVPSLNAKPAAAERKAAKPRPRPKKARKLGYKDQRELENLPTRIAALGDDMKKIEADLSDPRLFARDPAGFDGLTTALETARRTLEDCEERWLELEMMREELTGD